MSEVNIVERAELDKAITEGLTGKFDGLAKMSDVETKLKELTESLKPKEPEKKAEPAKMSEGVLANVAKTEFFGIEFGKIAIGTFGGVFTSEIIDGFLAAQSTTIKGFVKLAIAGTIGTWGQRWVGKEAAMAIALVIGVFGLSQVLPVDKWAQGLATQVRGILPGTIKVMERNPVRQAEGIARDYYAGLGGAR